MTEPPDWAVNASFPQIHEEPARNYQWDQISEDQLQSMRSNLLDSILQVIVEAVTGLFIPDVGGEGEGGDPFDQLFDWAFDLLDFSSPLDSNNLQNPVPPRVVGQVPFSSVGEGNPNLFTDPGFSTDISVRGSGVWSWDSLVGRTTAGSAYTIADGTDRPVVFHTVPVTEGQTLNLSLYSKWSGLESSRGFVYGSGSGAVLPYTLPATLSGGPVALGGGLGAVLPYALPATLGGDAGGDPIKLQVVRMLDGAVVGTDDLDVPTGFPAEQAAWIRLGGDYTVPAGVDAIAVKFLVADSATAGTVWCDEGDIRKTGSSAAFVPNQNVTGVGGPYHIGGSLTSTWDQLIGGLVGELGFGASLADMFNVPRDVSSWAAKGRMGWDILGIRNNKSLNTGFLPTTESTIGLDKVALQSSAPTFGITQSTAITGYRRISEAADYAVVSWQGYGITNITDCYVNIYRMDTTNGVNTLVHASSNQVALLTGGSVPVPVVYIVPTPIPVTATEVYGTEITIRGPGTHNIVGSPTWLQDQAVYPRRYSSVRNSGTSAAPATFTPTYSSNVPFIEFGVTASAVAIPHSPETVTLTTVGSESTPIPGWAAYVDAIAMGSGGGGGGRGLLSDGEGGRAGSWAVTSWARGTHFSGVATVSTYVPQGGAGGFDELFDEADPGASATASIPGYTVTAAGGAAGRYATGLRPGLSPGNQIYDGVLYVGGGVQNTAGAAGTIPGGGGAGTNNVFGRGGAGGRGSVWLVFRQV